MAQRGSLHCFFYFIWVIFAVGIRRAGSLSATVRCSERAESIYIDGERVGSTTSFAEVWNQNVTETAGLFAVHCNYNTEGSGLLIASFSNGLASDETWRCSGTHVSDWYGVDFDDSDWKRAHVIKTNAHNGWPRKDDMFPDGAKWIWKDSDIHDNPTHSYCRGHIGPLVATVRGNDKAESIYIDGKRVGSTAAFDETWARPFRNTTRLIAVDVSNAVGAAAIITSFSNGFVSDETWRCSGTQVSRWYGLDFDDSDWETAYVIKTNGVGTQWPEKDDRFPDEAKWIWKDDQYDSPAYKRAYCRGHIECGCEYKCEVTGDYFTCLCPDGYVLNDDIRTCRDVDECTEIQDSNLQHGCEQQCFNVKGSYHCTCNKGFTLDDDRRQCNDIDECASGNHTCSGLFRCSNTIGGHDCVCQSGYSDVENSGISECVDIDECSLETSDILRHDCEHFCNNQPGSYKCQCRDGFTIDNDGRHCNDIDECAMNHHDCFGLSQCVNRIGWYQCVCPRGYNAAVDRSIVRCVDDNECERFNGLCEQTCENTNGSYICSCNEGSLLQDDDRTCGRESDNSVEYSNGFIASIVLNVALVILLIVFLVVLTLRRININKKGAGKHNSDMQSETIQSVTGLTEILRPRSENDSGAQMAETAVVADYRQVAHSPTRPYESLKPRVIPEHSPYEHLP